jgi:hypothetical protein
MSPSFRPPAVSQHLRWTVPVPNEETLAVREKFRQVGWRQPKHKPKATKAVARAKSLWGRCLTPSDLLHLSHLRVHVTDDVVSGIVFTSALILINTFSQADPLTSKPRPTRSSAQPRGRRTKPSASSGNGCAKPTVSWPMDRYTLQQVRRVRHDPCVGQQLITPQGVNSFP